MIFCLSLFLGFVVPCMLHFHKKFFFSSYQLCPVFIKNSVVQTEKKAKEISIMLYYLHGRNYNCKNKFFSEKSCGTTSRVTSATIKTQEYV